MKKIIFAIFLPLMLAFGVALVVVNAQTKPMKPLTDAQKRVIIDKGTEAPFTGKYFKHFENGTYNCAQCGAALYRSADKFESECGWPSFDDEIEGAVKRVPDKDGRRTEIVCARCGGHLGHVFTGEKFTDKDTRHCVNSLSLDFAAAREGSGSSAVDAVPVAKTAIFAGGCFWGVEHLMQKQAGVISVESGYTGGTVANPTYEQVCTGRTGHAEAVLVTYNPALVSYETLAKLFFEIHDPEQTDGQGPDLGSQYRSEIFYSTAAERVVLEGLVAQLTTKGYKIATRLTPAITFYPAEKYHQDYYVRKGSEPYCHSRTQRF